MENHVCTLDTVTGNLAVISRFHHFPINERYDFFFIFRNSFFVQNTASFTMVIKRCPGGAPVQVAGGQLRNPPVKFRHER